MPPAAGGPDGPPPSGAGLGADAVPLNIAPAAGALALARACAAPLGAPAMLGPIATLRLFTCTANRPRERRSPARRRCPRSGPRPAACRAQPWAVRRRMR